MPRPKSSPKEHPKGYLLEREPTELHEAFAEYIQRQTGCGAEDFTPKHAQLAVVLRSPFQASPDWQARLDERAAEREELEAERVRKREEREAARAAKAAEPKAPRGRRADAADEPQADVPAPRRGGRRPAAASTAPTTDEVSARRGRRAGAKPVAETVRPATAPRKGPRRTRAASAAAVPPVAEDDAAF